MKTNSFRNKLIRYSIILALPACFFSCKKVDELLTFDISNSSNITIAGTSPINLPVTILTPAVTTNSTQQFQNNNSSASHVKDIRLDHLQLTITNPSDLSFAFVQSIHIYISINSSNEIELASADNISTTANTIELTPTQAKLDDYVKSPSYNLRTQVVIRQSQGPGQDVDIRVDNRFKVTADL